LTLYLFAVVFPPFLKFFPLLFTHHSQDYFSQKIGDAFPTAWEIPPGTVCTGSCAHSS
jgi:hypothetical protein